MSSPEYTETTFNTPNPEKNQPLSNTEATTAHPTQTAQGSTVESTANDNEFLTDLNTHGTEERTQDEQTQDSEKKIREEITHLALEMAKASDSSKNQNLSSSEKEEILKMVKLLEQKKEELTKTLPSYDPRIAENFRTSTPEGMDIEIGTRKRTASESNLNRSFSESDISQPNRKLKNSSMTSFLLPKKPDQKTQESDGQSESQRKTESETDKVGFTLVARGREKFRVPRSNSKTPKPKSSQRKTTTKPTINTPPPTNDTQKPQTENANKPNQNPKPSTTTENTSKENDENQINKNTDTTDQIQTLWEKYIKSYPTPDANALQRHFRNIYKFLKEQDTNQTKKQDNSTIQLTKEIQEIKQEQIESKQKQEEITKDVKEIKKMLETNNKSVQNTIKQIDKTTQQLGRQNKKEEFPDIIATYAEKCKKQLQYKQIATKNSNKFEFIITFQNNLMIEEEQDFINFLSKNVSTSKFKDTEINFIRVIRDGTAVKIVGRSAEIESLKNEFKKAIGSSENSAHMTLQTKKTSEVMKITALNTHPNVKKKNNARNVAPAITKSVHAKQQQ
ncbi:unnamed protein product [Bemisia tabaci]|uniref:Uncharacterized protein n=1 Tax=Bemisia tabaci TaxID=7038 RepID=A0A9P0EYM0_BEMTA|nr:unnamed protein product [Bemisia tabaci]